MMVDAVEVGVGLVDPVEVPEEVGRGRIAAVAEAGDAVRFIEGDFRLAAVRGDRLRLGRRQSNSEEERGRGRGQRLSHFESSIVGTSWTTATACGKRDKMASEFILCA